MDAQNDDFPSNAVTESDKILQANPYVAALINFAGSFVVLSVVHYFIMGNISPYRTFVAAAVATAYLFHRNRRKK